MNGLDSGVIAEKPKLPEGAIIVLAVLCAKSNSVKNSTLSLISYVAAP